MSDVFSFVTKDGKIEFTVKTEFKTKCPDYKEHSVYDLMVLHKINQYLHNPGGPAIHRLKDGRKDYWLDGQILTQEQGEKLAHNHQFGQKLQETINE